MTKSQIATLARNALMGTSLIGMIGCSPAFKATDAASLVKSGTGGDPGVPNVPVPQPPPGVQFKFQCSDQSTRGTSEKLRRLTRNELVNTLSDLLGGTIMKDTQIVTQLDLMNDDNVGNAVYEFTESFSENHARALLKIVTRAADLTFATTADRDRIYGTCSGQSTIPDDCVVPWIKSFGLKALRRPLTDAEVATHLAIFRGGPNDGYRRVLMRFLLSPSLAFHVELGTTSDGKRVRLNDYEVASRISYRITGTFPDDQLFAAAAAGQLGTLEAVKSHAERLLRNHPRGKAKVREFFQAYLGIHQTPVPNAKAAKDVGIETAGLQQELIEEFDSFVENIVFNKNGTFKDLILGKEVFPKSARMAKILETQVASGNTPSVTTDGHKGIYLRPAFLASSTDRTKTLHRGINFRKRVLCTALAAADPELIQESQNAVGDTSTMSNREALTKLTGAPACAGCHSLVNPLGFVLEGYDQLGMSRTTEYVFDDQGNRLRSFPVNTQVNDPLIEMSGWPKELKNGEDLANHLALSNAARSCFAQTLFEFQRRKKASVSGASGPDSCAIREVESASTDNGTVLGALVAGVANNDIFFKAQGN